MSKNDDIIKEFPEDMEPLGNSALYFRCGPDVKCYMSCCRKLDLILYPYDIIRLKRRLSISSEEFVRSHTRLGPSSHPFFPAVMLRCQKTESRPALFWIRRVVLYMKTGRRPAGPIRWKELLIEVRPEAGRETITS